MKKYPLNNILWKRLGKAEIKRVIKNHIRYLCLCIFLFCTVIVIALVISWNRHRLEAKEMQNQKEEASKEYRVEYETQVEERIEASAETKEPIMPPIVLPCLLYTSPSPRDS